MHKNATKMRMEKNYTTFGKKLHSIQMARPPNETILEARFGILPGKQAGSKTDIKTDRSESQSPSVSPLSTARGARSSGGARVHARRAR